MGNSIEYIEKEAVIKLFDRYLDLHSERNRIILSSVLSMRGIKIPADDTTKN